MMKYLTIDNYNKAVTMIMHLGYDKHNAEKIASDLFHIVEKQGKTVEFYIEALPKQN